jgi:O-antigen/teichoic acid export membrane protein
MSQPEAEAERSSLAASSALILVAQIVASAGYFVAVTIVAKTLGASGRGAVAFVTVSSILVASVAELGVGTASAALVPTRREIRDRLLTNGTLLIVASSVALGAVYFGLIIGFELGPSGVDSTVLALCVPAVTCLILTHVCAWFLLAVGRTVAYAVLRAATPWLYPLGLVFVGLQGDLTVDDTLFVWVAATAAAGIVTLLVAARIIGFGRPSLTLMRESVPFGIRAWIGGLANSLNFRTDQVLMGFLATSAALGIYAVAVNVSEILLYAPMIVGQVLIPQIARTDPLDRDKAVSRVFRLTMLVTAVASIFAVIVCPFAIPAWFGSGFQDSVTPFLLLVPGIVGFVALNVFSSALVGSARPGRSSIGPAVALAVGFALDLLLIRPFGANGAAIAATAAFLTGGLTALVTYFGPARISIVTTSGSVTSVSLSPPFVGSLIPGRRDVGEVLQIVTRLSKSLRGPRR